MMKIYNWLITVWLLATTTLCAQSSGADIMGWYDAGEFLWHNSNAGPDNIQVLQYDSGYYWLDENGIAKPFNTFAAGNVFDLSNDLWSAVPSPPMQPILPVRNDCPFIWDSLRFNYFYLRGNTDTSITDTLFIYYYSNFNRNDSQLVYSPVIFGTDTCNAATPGHFNFNELSERYFRRDTLLLRNNDTASVQAGRTYKTVVNRYYNGTYQVKHNYYGLFGYSLSFKPGSPAPLFDTLFDTRDSSTQENVLGVYCKDAVLGPSSTFPPQFCSKFYTQNSFFLYKENRYGGTSHGMEGFLPGLYFLNELPDTYARFLNGAVHITASPSCFSSVKKTSLDNYFNLYPNPASPGEEINIKTGNQPLQQATITITDLLGRQVYNQLVNAEDLNNYTIISPLTEGVYTITITDAGNNNRVHSARLFVAR